jgi:uroporphyrin-III C-methyltransferase
MKRQQHTGKVIIAGAGPGDPELLTLKALRYLQQADIVITDRLVSEVILEEYVNKQAIILHTGKQSGKGASTLQTVINELMVDYAQQGKLVVRLKGGDASVFSNILDELQALRTHGIEYEIIPGVTAALGAAAYAGIPLTARNYATAVRFLTCYRMDLLEETYWKDLAQTEDTLVFYMSSEPLDLLVEKLVSHGIAEDRFISVIEQATTPMQRVTSSTVHRYAKKGLNESWVSPTLVIIGRVASLQEQFAWLPDSEIREHYFKPVGKNKPAKETRA